MGFPLWDRRRTSCLPASTCVRPPRPPLTSIGRFALVPTPPSSWAHSSRVCCLLAFSSSNSATLQLCCARTANDRITVCPDLVTLLSSHQVRVYKAARDKLARPPCRTRATQGVRGAEHEHPHVVDARLYTWTSCLGCSLAWSIYVLPLEQLHRSSVSSLPDLAVPDPTSYTLLHLTQGLYTVSICELYMMSPASGTASCRGPE